MKSWTRVDDLFQTEWSVQGRNFPNLDSLLFSQYGPPVRRLSRSSARPLLPRCSQSLSPLQVWFAPSKCSVALALPSVLGGPLIGVAFFSYRLFGVALFGKNALAQRDHGQKSRGNEAGNLSRCDITFLFSDISFLSNGCSNA